MVMWRTQLNHSNHRFHSSNANGEGIASTALGTSWLNDKIYEQREADYLVYEENTVNAFEDLQTNLNDTDSITSMTYARTRGVTDEWTSLSFFADDNVNAPDDVFQYVDDSGAVNSFTQHEQGLIRDYKIGDGYPIEGIEGHHIETVRANPDNLTLAADQDNIVLATETGHHKHLHSGDNLNDTNTDYDGMFYGNNERLELTLDYNQNEIIPTIGEQAGFVIGGSILLFGTVSMTIEALKFKNDPRPWKQKRVQFIKKGLSISIVGGLLAGVGFIAKESFPLLMSSIGDVFSGTVVEHAFSSILLYNGVFFVVTVSAAMIKYWRERQNGIDRDKVRPEFGQIVMIAGAEFMAFQALGIGFDVLGGMVGEALLDGLIPDPTGIIIGLRVGYGLLKMGKKALEHNDNRKAVKECTRIRLNHYYGEAIQL